MRLAFVGTGYVGLVTGMCFAHLGHQVSFVDRDEILIGKLKRNISSIYEPGLNELMEAQRGTGRTQFHSSFETGLIDAEAVFLCVGTPTDAETGEADLRALHGAATGMAPYLRDGMTLVLKSTVPVGTNASISALIKSLRPDIDVFVASNPEFLREGSAVEDFLKAERIVVGVREQRSRDTMTQLYGSWSDTHTQLVLTTPENAELSKYASNAFLAMKISFINEIANICEKVGAQVEDVAAIMGMDQRIGSEFLKAGPGYGGSCFPKDTLALAASARKAGVPTQLIETTIRVNAARKQGVAERVVACLADLPVKDRSVCILGITFKANTDDVRDSPGLDIVQSLKAANIAVSIYDPMGADNGRMLIEGARWGASAVDAARGAAALIVLTEWPEFGTLDLGELRLAMRGEHLFDMRNVVDAGEARAAGFNYVGVGQGMVSDASPMVVRRAQLATLSRVL
jgi:UDPglucose 6-dehydrogenase